MRFRKTLFKQSTAQMSDVIDEQYPTSEALIDSKRRLSNVGSSINDERIRKSHLLKRFGKKIEESLLRKGFFHRKADNLYVLQCEGATFINPLLLSSENTGDAIFSDLNGQIRNGCPTTILFLRIFKLE